MSLPKRSDQDIATLLGHYWQAGAELFCGHPTEKHELHRINQIISTLSAEIYERGYCPEYAQYEGKLLSLYP